MPERIFLFDLDGVLIQPGGYRTAVRSTLNYFASRLGVGPQVLEEETLSIFESQGITSEWDMVPITLGILLNQIAAQMPARPEWMTIHNAIKDVAGCSIEIGRIDYETTIRKLPAALAPPLAPSDAIIQYLNQRESNDLFPHLHGRGILQDLFGQTRDLQRCMTSSIFQNFILGDRLFNQTYRTKAFFPSESYLDLFDRVLIETEWQTRIHQEVKTNFIKIAAITARPCLPPTGIMSGMSGYSPEAEQAIRLAGFAGIPFIGYGSIQQMANVLQQSPELFLKPSPVQALAALRVAMGDQPWPALVEAARLAGVSTPKLNSEQVEGPIDVFKPGVAFSIHIFEDSPNGIQATQAAAQILKRLGLDIHLYGWGITQNADKKAALQKLGAQVFCDVNQALRAAFQIEQLP